MMGKSPYTFRATQLEGAVLEFVAQPVKRKAFIILTLASLLAAIAYAMRTPTSYDWTTFQPTVRETFRNHGYVTIAQRGANPDEIALPFRVWLHRPFQSWHGPAHFEIGFPNGAECYTVRCQDSLDFDCAV